MSAPRHAASTVERVWRTTRPWNECGEPKTAAIDILTDLRHFCTSRGVDFESVLVVSEMHWEAEQAEEILGCE